MDFEIRDVDPYKKPDEISLMNPYGDVPVLVDRELTLYESNIINEFIILNSIKSIFCNIFCCVVIYIIHRIIYIWFI